jgi:C-terminal processing protease CtpA/Prc
MIRYLAALLSYALLATGLEAAPDSQVAIRVAQLADSSFATREKAGRELVEMGKKARIEVEAALVKAYLVSEDPEVRFRSREILTGLFASSLGYLGIQYGKRQHMNADGEEQWGIVVNEVRNDSPASKAKLRVGDIILRVNGQRFGMNADQEFARRVKETGAEQALNLQLERDGESLQLKVILGTWPNPITLDEADALFERRIPKG